MTIQEGLIDRSCQMCSASKLAETLNRIVQELGNKEYSDSSTLELIFSSRAIYLSRFGYCLRPGSME